MALVMRNAERGVFTGLEGVETDEIEKLRDLAH
eukprot:CAMPEP_0198331154 /NCGR_PEP_ID=MMETSP1450-20131203/17395_1 /TAXON_ID=753684 ORGANISM="Madagascaria erythrocladiodes, Strain CCMP3234" /NCGR_SAMPLE_ID=MMETSP1450 /ASSEMBLY_ACC=CAM_ASM_001115 /LENGTH=32 /DNA_ID= /DNA_START= /DNA_END= /DNA_ORIENTATION=